MLLQPSVFTAAESLTFSASCSIMRTWSLDPGVSGTSPGTRLPWVPLPGVQDSWPHSSEDRWDTQASSTTRSGSTDRPLSFQACRKVLRASGRSWRVTGARAQPIRGPSMCA